MAKYVLSGAKLVPFDGVNETIEKGIVVVNGKKIEYVGSADDFKVDNSYEIYDVSGKTIIPGCDRIYLSGYYD